MSDQLEGFVPEPEVKERPATEMEKLLAQPIKLSAAAEMNKAELEAQYQICEGRKRKYQQVLDDAIELATLNADIAGRCLYSVPRAGKRVAGPSIRLAEIMASAWGSLRITGRVIDTGDKTLVAQGIAIDTIAKNSWTNEVPRRITTSEGKRYSDDMIVVTGNAAISIAIRNAVFRAIPFALTEQVMAAVKRVIAGDSKSIAERRVKAIETFTKAGIPEDRIYKTLGVKGVNDIGVDELACLQGIFTQVRDGDLKLEDAFSGEAMTGTDAAKSRTQAIIDQGKANKDAAVAAAKKDEPPKKPSPDADSFGDDMAAAVKRGDGAPKKN